MQQMASNYVTPDQREEQRQAQLEAQRRRELEMAEQNRLDMEAYNASIPQTRTPMAKQEIGGGGYSSSPQDRFNPTRAAPSAPRPQQGQQTAAQRPAQRQAPSAPTASGPTKLPINTQQSSSSARDQNGSSDSRSDRQDPRYPNGQSNASQQQRPAQQQQQPPSRLPAPVNNVKPLNVAPKPAANGIQQNDAVKAAEAALTAKPAASERSKDVRMSTMSENEVMAKLKEAVSKDDPNLSYSKQKKIGQGASGSVYVAKVKENPASPVAREVLRQQGSKAQVAIKQMDLAHQPRKELIVNEIMVMKDSKHRNIVNFLDAFLRNNYTELWVVMEYMEGGALTDVIDNNSNITEDQISTICLEVRFTTNHLFFVSELMVYRPAADLSIFMHRASSIVISRVTTFCSMRVVTSRSVSFFHIASRYRY